MSLIPSKVWYIVRKDPNKYTSLYMSIGSIVSLGYFTYKSPKVDNYITCVLLSTQYLVCGASVGYIIGSLRPVALLGIFIGVPMWVYQQYRFPDKIDEKPEAEEKQLE